MKIGILTSSRADYGIYQPLIDELKNEVYFTVHLIVFGTHTSKYHGYTLNSIDKESIDEIFTITTNVVNDDAQSISTSYALTAMKFADFWAINKFDLVFCLGDRYEMNAAVQAGIAQRVVFAHIHGGETTLGAIDDVYRHQLTLASKYHFTTTEEYAKRVAQIKGGNNDIYVTGSLSLDSLDSIKLPSKQDLLTKFNIPDNDYILITFHSETVSPERNIDLVTEMENALTKLAERINLIITMPNADTYGSIFRERLIRLNKQYPDKVFLIENFGKISYFAAIKYSRMLLGNTSSGIIEAASFKKYVVNVGDRQKGRVKSDNVIDSPFRADHIYNLTIDTLNKGDFNGVNKYYKKGAVKSIIDILKGIQS